MYNEDIKNAFLNSSCLNESTKKLYIVTFDMLEPYEESRERDLYTFDKHDIESVRSIFSSLRSKTGRDRMSCVKQYIRWCNNNGINGVCSDFLELSGDFSDNIKNIMLSSPSNLRECLDVIFEKEDLQTTDCIYRCYCWMAYAGMHEDDAMSVMCSDIDFVRMKIIFRGNEYNIYNEAYQAFYFASTLKQFRYNHSNYSTYMWRERVQGSELMRGIRGTPSSKSTRVEISRRNKKAQESGKTDMQLSYNRIRMSGKFYRMYIRELAGEHPDFRKEARSEYYSNEKNIGEISENYLEKKTREYIRDYERWKSVFYGL